MTELREGSGGSTELPDEVWVARVVSGQTEAFRVLVQRHQEKSIRLAYAFTKNFEDARDIAQTAFVKAFRSLERFRGDAKFSTWLYRIVVNQCKDFLKSRKEISAVDESIFEAAAEAAGIAAYDRKPVLGIVLTDALERLGSQQRRVVTLRYLEGFSVEETARIMEIAPGTVKATAFQALKILKSDLSGKKAGS